MKRFNWSRSLRPMFSRQAKTKSRAPVNRPLLEELESRLAPATFRWTGAGPDNLWSTGLNWSGGVAPLGLASSLDDIIFPATTPTGLRNTVMDVVVPGGLPTFNSIVFESSGFTLNQAGGKIVLGNPAASGSGQIIVNPGAKANEIRLDIELAGASGDQQFFTVNTGGELILSGNLTGSSGSELTKAGTGLLVLGGDNSSYSGVIKAINNGGIIRITNEHALGDTTGSTTIGTNAQLQVSNLNGPISEYLILNGPGVANDGALYNFAGNNEWAGTIQLDSNVTFGGLAGSLDITGEITDLTQNLSVTKEGAANVIFSNNNTYDGQTIINDGVLTIRQSHSLGEQGVGTTKQHLFGTIVNTSLTKSGSLHLEDLSGNGILVLDELLYLNGSGFDGLGALRNIGGNNEWASNIVLASPFGASDTVGIGAARNTSLLISGVISNPPTVAQIPFAELQIQRTPGVGLDKVDVGQVILDRANTYTGFTDVLFGTLTIRDSSSLGSLTSGTLVRNGATLALEIDSGLDPHGNNRGDDSVTHDPIRLRVAEPLEIAGDGIANLGALRSISGINTYAANIVLSTLTTRSAIGVDADPTPLTDNSYFTDDYSLTIATSANIQNDPLDSTAGARGRTLSKVGFGHLILPGANSYIGPTDIRQGWITIQNNASLGSRVPGIGDTVQPRTFVRTGAALHLKPLFVGQDLTISENLTLAGSGIDHPFSLIGLKGAVMNLGGNNTLTGDIQLFSTVGVGVERLDPHPVSELTTTGSVSETPPTIGVGDNASGGPEEYSVVIDTGSDSGTINLTYDFFGIPDQLVIYYGPRGTPGSTIIFDTGLVSTGAPVNVSIPYGPGISNSVEIVVNEGGSTQPFTAWTYNATITPTITETGGGIRKLGSRRLRLQGDGTYSGIVDIAEGVLTAQNDSALGFGGTGTVVRTGASLELESGISTNNGGISAGIQTWNEKLTLNGTGNAFFGTQALTTVNGDHMWRGTIDIGSDATIDIRANTRLTVMSTIDDSANPLPQGSVFRKIGQGELLLGGVNTYRGVTQIDEGIVTILNGAALGSTQGGTVVANGATLQLEGGITVAGEELTLQGAGPGVVPTSVPLRWFNAGPGPIENGQTPGNEDVTGRVTGVAIDPSDPNVIYISTAGGGAWKTKNAGVTWVPLFENNSIMFGGSIAIAPSDPRVIYFGTGETNNSGDSYYGTGVYRSSDSGKTWTLLGGAANPINGQGVSKIVVDPTNANRIYAATSDLVVNGYATQAPGIWRWDGSTWFNLTGVVSRERNPATSSKTTGVPNTPGPDDDFRITFPQQNATWSDLVLTTGGIGSGIILYAALGTAGGSNANAVYRCENPNSAANPIWFIGNGWLVDNSRVDSRNSNAFPNPINVANRFPSNGNIKLGLSGAGTPGSGSITLYAAITHPFFGSLYQLLKSADGGHTWNPVGTAPPNYMSSQGWYDSTVAVQNANTVIVGGSTSPSVPNGAGIFRTTDGGTTWVDISQGTSDLIGPHADIHASAFDSQGRLIIGTDGGVWRLNTAAPIQWGNMNGNLQITTFSGIAVHPTDPNFAAGGSQDNGTELFNGALQWQHVDDGDGGEVIIDPKNPTIMYHVLNGTLRKSTNSGAQGSWVTIQTPRPFQLYYPLVIDTVDTNRLLVGGEPPFTPSLWETPDGGTTWTSLNAPITPESIGLATYQGSFTADTSFPLVVDKGINTYDPDTIYITNGSEVWVTKNHGVDWAQRDNGLLGSISDIIVDPRSRDTAYVVRNAFGGGRVFRTTDSGRTWLNISAGLPDVPVWKIVIDPRSGTLYIGTDTGVFSRAAGANSWTRFGEGLANVLVRDLELNQTLNILSAGTYGRSMYQFFLPDNIANSGALRSVSGANVWNGNIKMVGDTTLYAGGTQAIQGGISTASLTIVGTISDATFGANYKLTKDGQGDVILAGSNTYGGLTEIVGGALVVQHPNALGRNPSSATPGLGTKVNIGTSLHLQSSIVGEPLDLYGDGIPFNGHNTGALRNVSNNNTYSGPINLMTNSTIGVDSGTRLTITGVITDAANTFSLTKELTGTLVLAAANTYDGFTVVQQGVLQVQNALALGPVGSAGTDVIDGAQLQIQGGITVNETLRLSGVGVFGTGALLNTGGDNTWAGNVTLTSLPNFAPLTIPPTVVSIGVSSPANTLTISGAIGQSGGTFGINKVGLGRLTLSNTNTYAGVTTVNNGALRVQNGGALGTTANGTTVRSGAMLEIDGDPTGAGGGTGITVTSEALILNGTGISVANSSAPTLLPNAGAVYNVSGTNTWTGGVTLQTTSSMGAAANSQLTFSGVVGGPNTSNLSKVGQGKVVFSNANTYTGATTISEGVLNIQNALGLGAVGGQGTTVQNGATLQLQGGITVSEEPLVINGPGFNNAGALENFSGNNTWMRLLTLGSSTSIGVTGGADTLVVNKTITDNGNGFALTKVGPGTLEFSGDATTANTYTGLTTVNNGTLRLNKTPSVNAIAGDLTIGDTLAGNATVQWVASDQIINTATVQVLSDGLLDLNAKTETFAALVMVDGQGTTGTSGTGTLTVNSLNMTGGTFNINTAASQIILNGNVTANSTASTAAMITGLGSINLNGASRTFNVANGPQTSDLIISAGISGTGGVGFTKTGPGRLQLDGVTTFTGAGTISQGDVQVGGTIGAIVLDGGSLSGKGTVASITGPSGGDANGIVNPGNNGALTPAGRTGILRSGNVNWGSTTTFFVDLQTTTVDTGYDQLAVTGNIDITGAKLDGLVSSNINLGDKFTIITVTGGIVTGKFALPTGTTTPDVAFLGGVKFAIDYSDPTKVVLTRVKATVTVEFVNLPPNPSLYGQVVTYTAKVKPEDNASPVLPGSTVTFTMFVSPEYGTDTRTIQVDANGLAVYDPMNLTLTPLSVGTHTLTAKFDGDPEHDVQTVTLNPVQLVNKTGTSISVSPAAPTIVFGQSTSLTATIVPDITLPNFAELPSGTVTFTVDGIAQAPVVVNAAAKATLPLSNLSVGLHVVQVSYSGDGNFNGSQTFSNILVNVTKANSNVGVSANPPTTNFGDTVTFTATVSAAPPGSGTPTGSVSFYNGPVSPANLIGTRTLNAFGQASLSISSLLIGPHTINVTYTGNSNFNQGAGSLNYTVQPTATSTSLTRNPTSSVFGQTVTFFAGVTTASGATATGEVEFFIDGNTQGTRALNSSGVATFIISTMDAGPHTISANYLGTVDFADSGASIGYTVSQASTTVTVTGVPNPAGLGQIVTFSAVVAPVAPGAGTPTGQVVFNVDGNPQAPVNLVNGVATFTTNSLGLGDHTIRAAYNGSANFGGNVSVDITETIVPITTTLQLSSDVSPTKYGQSVIFTAIVQGGGGIIPSTGSVIFTIDGTDLVPIPITTTGVINLSPISYLQAGSHTIQARFTGGTDASASSDTINHLVIKADTTVTISRNLTSSTFGQAVVFTGTVSTNVPGTGVPTGLMRFTIDGNVIGYRNLVNGQASITVNTLTVGTHAVQIDYVGSNNQNGSTAAINHVVAKAGTKMALISNRNPGYTNQSVTFMATVSSAIAGMPTPQGNIVFVITPAGGATYYSSPIAVDSLGRAWLAQTLPAGNNIIRAVFQGSNDFSASSSINFSQQMLTPVPATHLAAAISPAAIRPNQAFNLTVSALTAANQIAPSFNGPATIQLISGPTFPAVGQLQGNLTATFNNGVAVFTGLQLNVAGRYLVKITSGNLSLFYNIFTLGLIV